MIRRSILHRACIAAAAVLAVAACENALIPLPEEGPPEAMEFSLGGFVLVHRTIEVRGDTVVLRRIHDVDPVTVDSVRRLPTAQEWRDFWDEAARAGVGRWNRRYSNENTVDGAGWALRIENDGHVLDSDGHNAWPDRSGREHHEVTPDFRRLVDAFGALAGEPM